MNCNVVVIYCMRHQECGVIMPSIHKNFTPLLLPSNLLPYSPAFPNSPRPLEGHGSMNFTRTPPCTRAETAGVAAMKRRRMTEALAC